MPSIATLRALVGLRSWAFALPKNTWNLGKSTLNYIKENPKLSFVGGATKDAVIHGVDAARGYVSDHVPSMPSMHQYADQQVLIAQGQYPAQQGQGMSLADFSPFSGFKNLLNTVTGGNTNMMSVAAMIPAAMLMFGNFGWMGKIASMMLGSMALKNMNHPASQQNMQMQYQPQMVQEQFQQNYNQQLAMADEKNRREEADDNVIMRRFHS